VYDLRGDHKAALKIGYGRYHHQLNPEPIEAVQNGLAISYYQWNDLNGDVQFQRASWERGASRRAAARSRASIRTSGGRTRTN